jgi:hypothetical protein
MTTAARATVSSVEIAGLEADVDKNIAFPIDRTVQGIRVRLSTVRTTNDRLYRFEYWIDGKSSFMLPSLRLVLALPFEN